MLDELHQTHVGMVRMKAIARSYVWWPGLDQQIEGSCRECATCVQAQSSPKKAPMHLWEYPTRRWERIHVDFAGPFLGKMFLITVDAYSKWCEVSIMNSSATSPTVEKLRGLFAMHGLPEMLVSDNGPCFASEEFAVFVKRNGIRHTFTAPYHPSSNGQEERVVRTVKEAMKKLKDGAGSLETKMHRFLFTYRTTPPFNHRGLPS